jgi:hypothetical protein
MYPTTPHKGIATSPHHTPRISTTKRKQTRNAKPATQTTPLNTPQAFAQKRHPDHTKERRKRQGKNFGNKISACTTPLPTKNQGWWKGELYKLISNKGNRTIIPKRVYQVTKKKEG